MTFNLIPDTEESIKEVLMEDENENKLNIHFDTKKNKLELTISVTGPRNTEMFSCKPEHAYKILDFIKQCNVSMDFAKESTGHTEVETISCDEFEKELQQCLKTFTINMKNINAKPTTFQQWYEMFGDWSEVGTDMEIVYHGPRE